VPWLVAAEKITTSDSSVVAKDHGVEVPQSPYKERFRQGAILVPRFAMFVVDAPAGPLGPGAGRRSLISQRSSQEKKPWKDYPSIKANVETAYIHPVYLGEQVLPFRTLPPREAVLPLGKTEILTPDEIEMLDGLNVWWSQAETAWATDPKSGGQPLSERMDYHQQLSAQLPVHAVRVVYPKAGNTLPAAIIRDDRAIIDHKLYWMPAMVESEAHYVCAILNSAPILTSVKPLQAIGLFGARDFDKNVFAAPFPTYDPDDATHQHLAALGKQAEKEAATVDVSGAKTFQVARKLIRHHLSETGTEAAIVAAVTELLLALAG